MMTRSKFIAGAALAMVAVPAACWAEPALFETPEAATAALRDALEASDRTAILAIFGPETENILLTGDPEEDRALWSGFLEDMQTLTRVEREEDRATLLVGRDLWPFPAPLVRDTAGWHFDADAAREEVLSMIWDMADH